MIMIIVIILIIVHIVISTTIMQSTKDKYHESSNIYNNIKMIVNIRHVCQLTSVCAERPVKDFQALTLPLRLVWEKLLHGQFSSYALPGVLNVRSIGMSGVCVCMGRGGVMDGFFTLIYYFFRLFNFSYDKNKVFHIYVRQLSLNK